MTIAKEDPRFWDVRLVDRRIRKGQVTRKDYEKHLKTLDDVEQKGVLLSQTETPSEPPQA